MKRYLLSAVCASFIVNYSSFAPAASFTPLGFLNNGTSSLANGISADGTVVVGNANSSVSSIATPFIWTAASGMRSLGSISGAEFTGSATAISGNGSVVVGQSNGLAYRWTATTGKATLGSFPSGTTSVARDVSADGSVVVGAATAPSSFAEAFRWRTGTSIVGLGDFSLANAVSADGSMVAGATVGAAGIWTEASGWTLIGDCCSFTSATAISADGSVVVGEQDPPGSRSDGAFIWTESDGYTLLGNLGQARIPNTFPADISGDGSIWVGTEVDATPGDFNDGTEAVIWDQSNGMRALRDVLSAEGIDLSEWASLGASGVSADGSIVAGWGRKTDGAAEAWIANITAVPIPSAIWLFGSGLFGLIGIARRKKSA